MPATLPDPSLPLPPPAPVLKWAGGKRALAPRILEIFEGMGAAPESPWIEPFVGGAAVFFHGVATSRVRFAALGDVNPALIIVYQALRKQPKRIAASLATYPTGPNWRDFYPVVVPMVNLALQVPLMDGSSEAEATNAAAIIWLNHACFNGLWRVNQGGGFNVPPGSYDHLSMPSREILLAASLALRDVVIRHADFETIINNTVRGVRLYCDPPYAPVSKTSSFTGYASAGFSMADQERLAWVCAMAVSRGVHVVASNSDVPAIRELWEESGFVTQSVQATRSISAKASGRAKIGELLFIGGPGVEKLLAVSGQPSAGARI